jgi:hypothetical protein
MRIIRIFVKYALSLFLSLFIATIAIIPLEGSPEPRSFPRLVWVIIFFTVFTLLFAWDSGYLNR